MRGISESDRFLVSGFGKERAARDFINICYQYYLALLSPTSPFIVKESQLLPGQLGLYVKGKYNIKVSSSSAKAKLFLEQHLWGALFLLTEQEATFLHERRYPSLYNSGTDTYILSGPISLANHRCSSSFGFKSQALTITHFEEALGLFAKVIDDGTLRTNEELLLTYSNKVEFEGFGCICPDCKLREQTRKKLKTK